MRLLAALLLCVIGLSGSMPLVRGLDEPLPHDAYIWQRAWTPPVIAAARRSFDIVRSWRILLAESDQAGRWTAVSVPWTEVAATGRPVVGVIRIDGRLDAQRMPALIDEIVARIAAAPLAGVEIDYDCPTSKLPAYARFLAELRTRLPRTMALSITALPTWMNSTQLEGLTRDLDEIVLQVHAVDDPRRGLFDADQAERWVRDFGRRIHRPFRVALPAYDVRVTWRPDGRLASVEGERPLLAGPTDGELLSASPQTLRRFLDALHRLAPDNLVGVVWFRLPTDADARAWSLDTWRAVVAGDLPAAQLKGQLKAGLVATERPGVWTVTLSNEGAVDAALPRQVRLGAACEMADGANGYRLASAEGPMVLETTVGGRLRAHRQRVIGWARCAEAGQEAGKGLNVVQ
jgi:uncharacterized protein DUF3142